MRTESFQIGHSTLRLMVGDITKVPADVIVNAANSALRGGGGVDGAIHRAGGPAIMAELDAIRPKGGCPTGGAVATGAGKLPAKYVFHAVGPVYHGGSRNEAEELASCYRTCLRMADERAAKLVSFPAISTGAYGYPVEEAARVAIETITAYLENGNSSIEEVLFVLFDEHTYDSYLSAMAARTANR